MLGKKMGYKGSRVYSYDGVQNTVVPRDKLLPQLQQNE